MNQVIQGDCLGVMATLPDNSIDLICTDPPYFGVKGGGDKGRFEWWDRQWDKPTEFLRWIDRLAEQWQRILKPNGSLYCFASPRMAARVEVTLGERFAVLSSITWDKQPEPGNDGWKQKADKRSLRSYWQQSEKIVFCEQVNRGAFLKEARELAGYSTTELCGLVGAHGRHNHGGAIRNWEYGSNIPSKEQYAKLRKYLKLPSYEDSFRYFSVSEDVDYLDVWHFPTVQAYKGKHPCEKPAAMLEHIITASSRPGAMVLDCFAGSGSTLVAAKKLGRQYIGIEIDPHWVDVAKGKLGETQRFVSVEERLAWLETQTQALGAKVKRLEASQQLSLWGTN